MPNAMPWDNDPEIAAEEHPEAQIGPDPNPMSDAWEAFREQLFGHRDRDEAAAAGVGLHPTAAQMLQMGLMVPEGPGAFLAGAGARVAGPAMARLAGAAPGTASRVAGGASSVARLAAEHPRATEVLTKAAIGGLSGSLYDERTALLGAALGALFGGRFPARQVAAAEAAAPRAATVAAEAAAAPAVAAPRAAAAAAPAAAAPAVPTVETLEAAIAAAQKKTAVADAAAGIVPRAASAAPAAAPKAAAAAAPKAAAKATPAASAGREVAAQHNTLMSFAKDIAKKNPKVGEKIWILLDDAGKPIRQLTPDQAGAAARAGKNTTWMKNLWS